MSRVERERASETTSDRERQRERETETDRQTERKRDRHPDRQTERERESTHRLHMQTDERVGKNTRKS